MAHPGGTHRSHTPLPQPHTITHIIVHICFYLPFHLQNYPISHIYPCSTPLLQQLTITKKITIFIRIPHNETITILLYKSHSNLHILPHTLPHDSLPRQTKTHPNYLSHYGWPALPLASVTVPLQNITTQICYYEKLCHTNRIKNFLTTILLTLFLIVYLLMHKQRRARAGGRGVSESMFNVQCSMKIQYIFLNHRCTIIVHFITFIIKRWTTGHVRCFFCPFFCPLQYESFTPWWINLILFLFLQLPCQYDCYKIQ